MPRKRKEIPELEKMLQYGKKKLNKIAARWPAKAMVQFFLFLQK